MRFRVGCARPHLDAVTAARTYTERMDGTVGGWNVVETLAVVWNDELAQRFPHANHDSCRIDISTFRCHGLHCNRCGSPTGVQGGHDCPDRPA